MVNDDKCTWKCSISVHNVSLFFSWISLVSHLFGAVLLLTVVDHISSWLDFHVVFATIFTSMALVNAVGLVGFHKKSPLLIKFYLFVQLIFALGLFAFVVHLLIMFGICHFAPYKVVYMGQCIGAFETKFWCILCASIGTAILTAHLYFGIHISNRSRILIEESLDEQEAFGKTDKEDFEMESMNNVDPDIHYLS